MDKVTIFYDNVVVVFEGTKVERFFKDDYLQNIVEEAALKSYTDNLYDGASYIFGWVDNAVKRHYSGQDIMLVSVEVNGADRSVTVCR